MKKFVAITIMAAVLLTVVSVAVMADATNWKLNFRATNSSNLNFAGDLSIGWYNGYTDGNDTAKPEVMAVGSPAVNSANAAIASELAPGILSLKDYRANWTTKPVLMNVDDPSNRLLWVLDIYTQVNGTGTAIDPIKVTVTPSTNTFPGASLPANAVVKFSGAYEHTWTATEFANLQSFSFNVTGAPTQAAPAKLYVSVGTLVPEPSSMVAMASGLLGMAGFAIRRRRA